MADLEPVAAIRAAALPLSGGPRDYDALFDLVGDARFVLLGEATHGTHEFYEERARITQRLIEEKGFHAVAVEADWPDAYRVNRYVRGQGEDADSHMAETLEALAQHLSKDGEPAKIVVWEHNSHIGDARATEVGQLGEWNVGELARKAYDGQTRLIGFSTYEGFVTAASEWDGPAEHKRVRPGMPGSYEELLHDTGIERFLLPLRGDGYDDSAAREALMQRRLERAIGVIYLPRTERQSHYFSAQMAVQFDAVIHIDRTTAVTPLDPGGGWHSEEPPETYPGGL